MWLLLSVSILTLPSCSKISPIGLLTGSGPNVAANTQIGKENKQAVVDQTRRIEASGNSVVKQVEANVSSEKVDNLTIQQTPIWMVILLIAGWLLPSPNEIGRWVRSLFKKKQA